MSHDVRGGNLFQCEETQVRLSMPIGNRAFLRLEAYATLHYLDDAQLNLEHPLVQGNDRITPEQPDDCTHGEVGAKRDF